VTWYTVTNSSRDPGGGKHLKRWIKDFRVAVYAQTFPPFWRWPPNVTDKWKWLGEAFPPLYARYLLLKLNARGKLLDCFAGVGGWSLGAILTGNFTYVELVEADPAKCRYLEINFKLLKKYLEYHTDGWDFNVVCCDIRRYEPTEKFDVVVGSPPCEDVSRLRALSHMLYDEIKGTMPLTHAYTELVERIRPKIAIYENVWSLKLVEALKKLGWQVEKHDMSIVIPQRRVRLIAFKFLNTLERWM